ncbi:hypothetical protein EDB80DRAFT_348432 [Ilyonectria destructans]|nr:hypothetical protein EDB80DRAFT_348432 [Ilyonectria destructans]
MRKLARKGFDPVGTTGTVFPPPDPSPKRPKTNKPSLMDIANEMAKKTRDGLESLGQDKTISSILKIVDGKISVRISNAKIPLANSPDTWEYAKRPDYDNDGVYYGDMLIQLRNPEDTWKYDSSRDEGITYHVNAWIWFKDSEDLWKFADSLNPINPIEWTLRYISSCARIVKRRLPQHSRDANLNGDRKKGQWENLAMMVNRIVSNTGLVGLRVIDVYACKPTQQNGWAELTGIVKNYAFAKAAQKDTKSRDTIADTTARSLSETRVDVPDDAVVSWPPTLVWSILASEISYNEVCEILGLHKYARVKIELPFVQLGQIKAKLIPSNAPRTPSRKQQVEPISEDQATQEPEETEEDRLLSEFFHFPGTSPLGSMEEYMIFGTSKDLQSKALNAGDCQRGYNVIQAGSYPGAEFYAYEWEYNHHDPVAFGLIRDMVGLITL